MKSIKSNLHPLRADTGMRSNEPDMVRLADLIRTYTPHDGSFELSIPGVHVARESRTNTELVHAVAKPSLCIIAQGAKSVMLGEEVYEYDASRMLIFSVDLPVTGMVTRASHSEPYLSFKLDIDPHKVAELVLKVFPHGLPRARESRAVCITLADFSIINAVTRLIELMAQPEDAELLAPLVIDEILIRLLRSPDWCPGGPAWPCGFRCARNCESGILAARQFLRAHESRRAGRISSHECFLFSSALQVRHLNEPPSVPEGVAPP